MTHFKVSKDEDNSLKALRQVCEDYTLLKVASNTHENCVINLQLYYSLAQNVSPPETSNIVYYKVIDEKCDCKETLLSILNDLYREFIQSGAKQYVILEGDQATYERLHAVTQS